MKEQVKLVGGESDGQTIEVYQGQKYAEVPFTAENNTVFGSEFYGRTVRRDDLPVFIPVEDIAP